MGPGWYGKDLNSLEFMMELYEVDNPKRIFELIQICIEEQYKLYSKERDKSIKSVKRGK